MGAKNNQLEGNPYLELPSTGSRWNGSVYTQTSPMAHLHPTLPPDKGKLGSPNPSTLWLKSWSPCSNLCWILLQLLCCILNIVNYVVLVNMYQLKCCVSSRNLTLTCVVLILSLCQPIQAKISDTNYPGYPFLHTVASAEKVGKLFVAVDTLSIDYEVPISQIEETIDFLSLKVSSMQYASDLEKLRPITLKSGDLTYTVFQSALPLHIASTVCGSFKLQPMSVLDIPRKFKVPYSVFSLIYHFEVLSSNNRLTCLYPTKVVPEHQCLDDIQIATQGDPSFLV